MTSTANNPTPALVERFDTLEQTLNNELVERRAEIRGAVTALVAGVHMYLLGPPGIAKSLLVNRLLAYISGARGFNILMTRFTTPEEVFGPVSLKGLEEDRFERKIDGYLADAEIAFLDEVYKANSSVLNSLLWILNERQYRHGDQIIDVPLGTVFGASNELPQDEALAALYDRLLFRYEVKPVRDQSNFVRMLRTQRPATPHSILTWDDILQAREEASAVIVPDPVLEALTELRRQLKEKGIEPTERRFVESLKAVRATAWLDGEGVADIEHLRPLQNCLWDRPEQIADVSKTVLAIASPLDQEASELLTSIDALEKQLDSISKDEEKHRKGTEIHGKLRRAKKQLDEIETKAGVTSRKRSEVIAETRSRLHSLTSRVLVEVFQFSEEEKRGEEDKKGE